MSSLSHQERLSLCDYLEEKNSSIENLNISTVNTILTKTFLDQYSVPNKQNCKSFNPSKKIKFTLNVHKGLELWMTYEPNEQFHLNDKLYRELEDAFKSRIAEAISGYESEFEVYFSKNKMFLNAENMPEKLSALRQKLASESWLKSVKIEPLTYPLVNGMKREIIVYAGSTNSGKTFNALKHFKEASSGLYVGPLRLNAIEVYEDMNAEGIACNLMTGEEKQYVEGSNHTASTVELMDFKKIVDVVLVDEGQFIDDQERGYNFLAAIAGARARKIIVTCPLFAADKIRKLADLLQLPYTLHKLDRKTKLSVTPEPVRSLKDIKSGTAVVSFSKRRVLELKNEIPKEFKVSVIYGALPPEVKRMQAKLFREGKTQVLLSTDVISLGLNLPIETVVFDTVEKFDGKEKRQLLQQEAIQTGGRAGRYGIYDEGFVSGTNEKDHAFLKSTVGSEDLTEMRDKFLISIPFDNVSSYVELTAKALPEATNDVYASIGYDKTIFELSDHEKLVQNLRFIDRVASELPLYTKWRCAHIPIEIEDCEDTYRECLYVLSGMSSSVEIDSSVLRSGKPFEDLYEGYQRLLADIDCVTWFMSSMGMELSNLDERDSVQLRTMLISKINKTLTRK